MSPRPGGGKFAANAKVSAPNRYMAAQLSGARDEIQISDRGIMGKGESLMLKKTMVGMLAGVVVLLCVVHFSHAMQLNVYEGDYITHTINYTISRLAVGDPSVADYKAERSGGKIDLLINGKKPGSTNLLVYDAQGNLKEDLTINVLVKNLEEYKKQIQEVLGEIDGLDMRVVSGKLLIEGKVTTPREMERIVMIVGNSPQVMNLAVVSPRSLQIVARTIQERLGDDNINVMSVKGWCSATRPRNDTSAWPPCTIRISRTCWRSGSRHSCPDSGTWCNWWSSSWKSVIQPSGGGASTGRPWERPPLPEPRI